jgi:Ni/Fe-hydrogenase subunit HybB-like protein
MMDRLFFAGWFFFAGFCCGGLSLPWLATKKERKEADRV